MFDISKSCVLCFNQTGDLLPVFKGDPNDDFAKLKFVIPELVLFCPENSVLLCSACLVPLTSSYIFKKQCLENNYSMRTYLNHNSPSTNIPPPYNEPCIEKQNEYITSQTDKTRNNVTRTNGNEDSTSQGIIEEPIVNNRTHQDYQNNVETIYNAPIPAHNELETNSNLQILQNVPHGQIVHNLQNRKVQVTQNPTGLRQYTLKTQLDSSMQLYENSNLQISQKVPSIPPTNGQILPELQNRNVQVTQNTTDLRKNLTKTQDENSSASILKIAYHNSSATTNSSKQLETNTQIPLKSQNTSATKPTTESKNYNFRHRSQVNYDQFFDNEEFCIDADKVIYTKYQNNKSVDVANTVNLQINTTTASVQNKPERETVNTSFSKTLGTSSFNINQPNPVDNTKKVDNTRSVLGTFLPTENASSKGYVNSSGNKNNADFVEQVYKSSFIKNYLYDKFNTNIVPQQIHNNETNISKPTIIKNISTSSTKQNIPNFVQIDQSSLQQSTNLLPIFNNEQITDEQQVSVQDNIDIKENLDPQSSENDIKFYQELLDTTLKNIKQDLNKNPDSLNSLELNATDEIKSEIQIDEHIIPQQGDTKIKFETLVKSEAFESDYSIDQTELQLDNANAVMSPENINAQNVTSHEIERTVNQEPNNLKITTNIESAVNDTTDSDLYVKCTICDKDIAQRVMYFHMQIHGGVQCLICKKKFSQNNVLESHMQNYHNIKPNLQCTVCKKNFAYKKNLDSHMKVHSGELPYSCNLCEKKFAIESALRSHKIVHTYTENETKLKCYICGKKFHNRGHLKMHIASHVEKNFDCEVCGKHFVRPENLWQHKKIHTGVKKYECAKCHKKFLHKTHLKQHVATHGNEKEFKCTKCEKSFSYNCTLQKHLAVHEKMKAKRKNKNK